MPAENAERGERREAPPSNPGHGDAERHWPDLRNALIAVVAERGYAATRLDAVLARAQLDRCEFDRHFTSLEDCCALVWQEAGEEFIRQTRLAYESGGTWREGVRRQAWRLCRFLQEDEPRTRFLIEVSHAEEVVQANRDSIMSRYIDYIHLGRFERQAAAEIPRARAEALVGAVWEGVAANVSASSLEALPHGVSLILYMTMQTYLGDEVAAEELARAPDDLSRYRRGEL
jgi:AcrR family transcriptional regulator